MSTTDYRNQEALNKALNIYRTYMRSFIIFHLKKIPGTNVEDTVINSVSEWRADEIERSLADQDIKSIIDVDDFPRLVVGKKGENWKEVFRYPLNDDEGFQNQLWLIKTCRDQSWAHPPEGDAESEGTRAYLFLIADVLRKIKKPDKQSELEAIRDKLFSDDTAERLEKAEEDNVEYKRSLAEAEQRLATAESEKNEYAEKNAALSKQVDEKENQRKKLDKQLKRAKAQNDKYKKDIAGTKQRLEESEAAQADYKNRLETTSKKLKGTNAEWKETKERLATALNQLAAAQAGEKGIAARLRSVQNLFTVAAIGEQEVQEVFQSVYPPIETDSIVRILDRRGVDKQDFLLDLLEQKQPTIIYVQSEDKIEQLSKLVGSEKADVIGEHNERTSEVEEMEILEKLENGELIAVVSNTAFSTLTPSYCVEHFVFCHLVPGLDEFFRQCEPAFTSEKNAYLHLIYNGKEDIKGLNRYLTQKPPGQKELREHYGKLKKHIAENRNSNEFVKADIDLNIVKLQFETMLTIFEELRLLEQNEDGIKLLPAPSEQTSLYKSQTYCGVVEKLKQEITDFHLKQPIEQIWEALLKELNVGNEQILDESSVYKVRAFQDAIRDSGTQSEQSTEAVENDSKADDEVSEAQSERPTETVENDNTVDGEDAEAKQPLKSARANAKVTEEQVREIRSRNAAGESYSKLAKEFDLSPAAVRNMVLRNTWKDVE